MDKLMQWNKEEQLLFRHLRDLANAAVQKGIYMYSSFLNLNELTIFHNSLAFFPKIEYQIFGGYQQAERQMICFYEKHSFQEQNFPISILQIKPVQKKFSDHLTHRDYLGAILNLGIERSKVGDILLKEEEAYVFCEQTISAFIKEELTKIKHTNVTITLSTKEKIELVPSMEEIRGSVSNVRIDSVLSVAFQCSRSSLTNLVLNKKVFVNSRIVSSNSYLLKDNDIVSVRGYGKFLFKGVQNETKKGRNIIKILKYS